MAISRRGFDCHIATLDVAGFGQARLNTASRCGSARHDEIADHWHSWLLRPRRDRPRRRCAVQCEYEFSPSDVDCAMRPLGPNHAPRTQRQ